MERVLLISWYKAAISLPLFRVLSSSSTMVASSWEEVERRGRGKKEREQVLDNKPNGVHCCNALWNYDLV